MRTQQFRVLYREFLFSIFDVEVLSTHARGDASTLLAQFAALLVFLSLGFSIPALGFADSMSGERFQAAAWGEEHFLIATTMLVVGLFAVLSWNSTFPERRDVLVLAPLPVEARTIFLAKVAAVGTALAATVVTLHSIAGLAWPIALNRDGFFGWIRLGVVYWATMLAAGMFVFGCVLGLQGVSALLLTRRQYLRVSGLLQLLVFCLLVSVYFLQPATRPMRSWSPSYWFVGLFQQLDGSSMLRVPAQRAWMGLAVAVCGAMGAYALCYLRSLRQIVEEPDIAPGARGGSWLPRFGTALETAIVQFSVRTLLRSRQHRLILAFYWGVGFAITVLLLKSPLAKENVPLLASSLIVMAASVMGARVVFSLPLDLAANWIFRVTPVCRGASCLRARRRSLWMVSIAPVWAAWTIVFLALWPWRPALEHVVLLGLFGMILAELCLEGRQKLPFTCSWLPGKSNLHIAFWLSTAFIMRVIAFAADSEQRILESWTLYLETVVALGIVVLCLRWRAARQADAEGASVQFEEIPAWRLVTLDLPRT